MHHTVCDLFASHMCVKPLGAQGAQVGERSGTAGSKCGTVDGTGSNVVIFGGFGFNEKQLYAHEAPLYQRLGFGLHAVIPTIWQVTGPAEAKRRGRKVAKEMMANDKPVVCHTVSGGFWTMLYAFRFLEPQWREQKVKAVVFDACPPRSDKYAFSGWVASVTKQPWVQTTFAALFVPYLAWCGVDAAWLRKERAMMYGDGRSTTRTSVMPRGAHYLFVRGSDDPVVDGAHISAFAAHLREQAQAGMRVEEFTFEGAGSGHAKALAARPDEYRWLVVDTVLSHVPEWRRAATVEEKARRAEG